MQGQSMGALGRLHLLALLLVGAVCSPAANGAHAASTETVRVGDLAVTVWQPSHAANSPLPLIVYSPGFTACANASEFLTSALADAGYIVAAPEHADSYCGGAAFVAPEAPFGKPQSWSEKTYRERGRDIARVVDAMKSDPRWAPRIDATHIGLTGHSLGGHVALALAGGFASWRRDDVKAVLVCAPLIGPMLAKGKLESIRVPVMYQAGARDAGTTALIKKKGGAYERTPSAMLAEIKGASHFAWSGDNPQVTGDIAALSVAFFDAKLKDKPFVRSTSPNVALFKSK
jgi:predicted dienelactone hydrolase